MSRWFRMYDAVLDDPKVQRLPDATFRAWVNLMCVASRNGGKISGNIEDLSFALRKSEGKTRELLQVLISSGLIDTSENGFEPHNWSERQYKSDVSTERVKRFRKQAETVSETPPETEAEQIQNRTEKKEDSSAAIAALPLSPEFIRLPTNRFDKQGEEVIVDEAHVNEFCVLFPAVDVRQQLRAMRGWLITNTNRRKTRKGMMAFVNGWLSKQQNSGVSRGTSEQSARQKPATAHDKFFAAAASFIDDQIGTGEAETGDNSGVVVPISRPLLSA